MYKVLREKLINSKFFKNILFNHDVIMIYLGGSRSLGLVDNISDYDLVVVTKNTPKEEEGRFMLHYQGTHIHWYYRTIEQLIKQDCSHTYLSYISGINLFNIENNIIWINPKHTASVNFILENKKNLIYNACWDFIFANPVFWDISQNKEIPYHCYNKYIYHLCNCYYILFNKDFEKEFLIKIKRLRWINNAQEELKNEIQKAYSLIKELYDYQETHDLKRKEIKEELLNKLKEVQ